MRRALATVAVSLGVHVAAAGAIFGPGLIAPKGARTLAGETFELPAPETAEAELANASPSPETRAHESEDPAASHETVPEAKPAVRPSHHGRPSGGRAAGAPDGTPGGSGGQALYGAVGDRSAVDLATAFTRGFPQVASVDPVWRTVPIGSAGEATVTITLDEAGRIESTHVTGAPSAALAGAIKKTVSLIGGRAFVAHGKTTKLQLAASVSNDAVHDDTKSPVFAIGGSYTGSEGSAFFALAIGRRVDLRVRGR